MTSAGVMFYMVMATSMGDDVACSVKLSKNRHVPQQSVNVRGQIYLYWGVQGFGVIAVRLSVLMM